MVFKHNYMEAQGSLKKGGNFKKRFFKFRTLKQTIKLLDCSKSYFYKLIRKNIIHSYYFEFDESGKPKGKPYFNIKEIRNTLSSPSK